MKDNIIFNTALERLETRFPNRNLIPIKDAAEYLGVDVRTLKARKDFPVLHFGCKGFVAKEPLAKWLAYAEG